MSTVNDVYSPVCEVLLEPQGLTLGVLTLTEFLNYYRAVMEDFLGRTGIIQGIAFMAQIQGQSDYRYPDWLSNPEFVFSDGAVLRDDYEESVSSVNRNWQGSSNTPRSWRGDKLAVSTVAIFPAPQISAPFTPAAGTTGIVAAWVPGGNLSQNQAFMGTLQQVSQVATFTAPGGFFGLGIPANTNERGCVCAIGALGLMTENVTLSSPIEHLDDDWLPFIKYGILQKVFASDSELRDPLREQWAMSKYEEGINLGRSIMGEEIQKD